MTSHFGHGAESAADFRGGDLGDVDVGHEEDYGGAESAPKGRDVHHGHAIGKDRQEPKDGEWDGNGEEDPLTAVTHRHPAQWTPEQGAQQGQAGDPGSFLSRHAE